ncbi:hypothetical protein SFRURICE_011362 [Spodoptera frugiperda]|nr:hypothetical protein SFRURICE_011362 [Spodoptera frugiperda]
MTQRVARTCYTLHDSTHDTQTWNNNLSDELFRAGIEPATRCTAASCPTTAPTVQSDILCCMI